tara:strand:- start:374 stop:541 length:168 start_codon:yes stop_codon:yes gene_type:complete
MDWPTAECRECGRLYSDLGWRPGVDPGLCWACQDEKKVEEADEFVDEIIRIYKEE